MSLVFSFYRVTVWSNTVRLTRVTLQMGASCGVCFNVHNFVTTTVLSFSIVTRVRIRLAAAHKCGRTNGPSAAAVVVVGAVVLEAF